MNHFVKIVFCCFLTLSSILISDDASLSYSKRKMVGDLEFIANTFDVLYAPKDWKRSYSGWDLDEESQHAKQEILFHPNPKTKDFYRVINRFIRSTKDYHCAVVYFSTEGASLPFRVKGLKGKYYFIYIDRARLPNEVFPFELGDELISFNGTPTDVVVQRLKEEEWHSNNPETDQTFSERMLTERMGYLGHFVPQGSVNIEVLVHKTGRISSYQLAWEYHPELVRNPLDREEWKPKSLAPIAKKKEEDLSSQRPLSVKNRRVCTPLFCTQERHLRRIEKEPGFLGSRKSLLPPLGEVMWESSDDHFFHAYLFQTGEQGPLIGYVRIPSYDGSHDQLEEFGQIMNFFEQYASAVVIDQLDNPGGSVFYLYALAATLTDRPLLTPKHRVSITQEDVLYAFTALPVWEAIESNEEAVNFFGETFDGYPVTYQLVRFLIDYNRFIIDQWNQGNLLTDPHHLEGVDQINPHPRYRFTKPIIMLVNEDCFSGGDFMPAILQDNQRATIFGKKTAGAGGYVLDVAFPNRWGIALIGVTGSIAERIDKKPIENLGVKPDIPYELDEEDLVNGYQGYVCAVHQALDAMLGKN